MKRKNVSLNEDDTFEAYRTPQALGKTVRKAKRHLPASPRKRKAVLKKIVSSAGISFAKKRCLAGNRGLSHQTTELVKSFYNDLVSRQAAGKKDFVTVRQDNKKEHLQKRHLLCSLQETFAIFVKDNPTVKISLSKFASLRPVNVKLSSDMPRDVCLCKYHEMLNC